MAEPEPGGIRPTIIRRAWNDFDTEWSDWMLRVIRQWVKPPRGAPPSEHKWEWARSFEMLQVEMLEQHECYHVDGDLPPNKIEISLAVARDDFAKHPERWERYDPDEKPVTAARRVWDAVKPLLKLNEETLRKAAEIRRQRGL
jgi:hypothetical protein